MRGYKTLLAAVVTAVSLVACTTTGQNFDPSKLSTLTPGQTTLEEASRALMARPEKQFRQTDGSLMALWFFKVSFVNDGLYRRKEAMLQFGPDGRLLRLVDSTNISLEPWEREKLLGPAPTPAIVYDPVPTAAMPQGAVVETVIVIPPNSQMK